jgi:hypothetical protein
MPKYGDDGLAPRTFGNTSPIQSSDEECSDDESMDGESMDEEDYFEDVEAGKCSQVITQCARGEWPN